MSKSGFFVRAGLTAFLWLPVLLYGSEKGVKINWNDARQIQFEVQIDSSDIKLINRGFGEALEITGYAQDGLPGQVPLPERGITVALPPGAKPTITFRLSSPTRFPVSQPAILPDYHAKTNRWEAASIIQRREKPPVVQIAHVGWVGEQYIAILRVMPAWFEKKTKAFWIFQRMDISLSYNAPLGKALSIQPPSIPQKGDSLLWQSLINPQFAARWFGRGSERAKINIASLIVQSENRARVVVDEDGWYRVTGKMLAEAEVNYFGRATKGIRVSYRGKEIPILIRGDRDGIFDENDEIVFHGEINHGPKTYISQYTEENVYVISWAETPGLRIAEVDGGLYARNAATADQFYARQRFEKDYYRDLLLLLPDEFKDHWFWKRMSVGTEEEIPFEIQRPDYSADSARVKIVFMGSTHPENVFPDHSVEVYLNDFPIGAWKWDGQKEFVVENLGIDPKLLKNGQNKLKIRAPGDTQAGEVDQFYLNWFAISYIRDFQAEDNYLRFSSQAQGNPVNFKIRGLTTDQVYILDPRGRRFTDFVIKRLKDLTYSIEFQDRQPGSESQYEVMTAAHFRKPVRIETDRPSDLRSMNRGADLIVISPKAFMDGIQPLVQHRRNQGLRVEVVDIEDVYDEFSGGNFDPEGIRDFLAYAYENWQLPRPRYVLLVGDAHFGFKKMAARSWGTTWIPTYMAYTVAWGITASDNYFVSIIGEDVLPDMAIGRLPCNSPEQLKAMVDKIIAYDTDPVYDEWHSTVNLSTGNLQFFETETDYLNDVIIPKDYRVKRLYTNPKSRYFGSTEELVDFFNDGAVIMNFVGHGGGAVFFDSQLFLLEDIPLIRNPGKWPVLLAWSCFIGYFDNPFTPSLGEELLRTPQYGTVANFGSAGRAWLYGDFFFSSGLFEIIFQQRVLNLGEIVRQAKIRLLTRFGGYRDLVVNYNLLGDPAMGIKLVQNKMSIEPQNATVNSGDPLKLKGEVKANPTGKVIVEGYVKDDSLISRKEGQVQNGAFQVSLPIPQGLKGKGIVRSYFVGDKKEAIGSTPFAIETPLFGEATLDPQNPIHQQAHYILLQPVLPKGAAIDTLEIHWNYNSNQFVHKKRMVNIGNGVYRSESPFQAPGGTLVYYQFRLIESQNGMKKEFLSAVNWYKIRRRADLSFLTRTIKIKGENSAQFFVKIKNYGEVAAQGFRAELYSGLWQQGSANRLSNMQVPGLQPGDTLQIDLKWSAPMPGIQSFSIVLDPDNVVEEASKSNNILSLRLSLATPMAGTGGAFFFSSDSNVAIQMTANILSENDAIVLWPWWPGRFSAPSLPDGVEPVVLRNGSAPFYQINGLSDTLKMQAPASVRLYFNAENQVFQKALQEGSLRAYFWDLIRHRYAVIPHTLNTKQGFVQAVLPGPGAVGLIRLQDSQPPVIEVKLASQTFSNGDFVARQPDFSAVISDNTGIDLSPQAIQLGLDGRKISRDAYRLSALEDNTRMAVIHYTPTLAAGSHQLTIVATDRFGNRSEKQLSFVVAEQFQLVSIANHPNPFQNETIIAFRLSQEAIEAKIKIYTVSGRLIRQWEYFNIAGYREQVWDGRDESGEEVANGVYYLRLTAIQGNKLIDRIEKMARLR